MPILIYPFLKIIMVKLLDTDIKTKEVKKWQGINILHFQGSSCSQKLRIFLKEKNINWKSHHVNLVTGDNFTDWFLGINPRGVVPVLVDNGEVHIESNDIIKYLDNKFPTKILWPANEANKIEKFLEEEDGIHLDLRNLTMKFVAPTFLMKKKEKDIKNFEESSNFVEGVEDKQKQIQLNFHKNFIKDNGISSSSIQKSINVFKEKLTKIDNELSKQKFIVSNQLTIVDIAWFVYLRRLESIGFTFKKNYPNLSKWYVELKNNENFLKETSLPTPLKIISSIFKAYLFLTGQTFNKYLNKD